MRGEKESPIPPTESDRGGESGGQKDKNAFCQRGCRGKGDESLFLEKKGEKNWMGEEESNNTGKLLTGRESESCSRNAVKRQNPTRRGWTRIGRNLDRNQKNGKKPGGHRVDHHRRKTGGKRGGGKSR